MLNILRDKYYNFANPFKEKREIRSLFKNDYFNVKSRIRELLFTNFDEELNFIFMFFRRIKFV